MIDAHTFSRRVSYNERLYLVAERLKPAFCIQIAVEGEGQLSLERLRGAVGLAAQANPGSRLLLRGRLGFSRWVACGPSPAVRVVGPWASTGAPPAEVERALSPVTGPTVEVVVSEGTNPRLVFRCFHGVMDARGLMHFTNDVFRCLRGEPALGATSPLTDSELVHSLVGRAEKRQAFVSDRRPVTVAPSESAATGVSTASRDIVWKRFSLAGPRPALVAKLAAALDRFRPQNPDDRLRVMIPVDLRNYLPSDRRAGDRESRSSGNLTQPLLFDIPTGSRWEDIHRAILKRLGAREPLQLDALEAFAKWLPLWLLEAGYARWSARHWRSGKFPVSVLISQLTFAGLPSLSTESFTARAAYFLPQPIEVLPLCVSIVSEPSSSQVVVSGPAALLNGGRLERLCAELETSLKNDSSTSLSHRDQ